MVAGVSTPADCVQQLCDDLAVTRRYTSDGVLVWNATDAGQIRDLAIDPNSGDIIVAGKVGNDVYLRSWQSDGTGDWLNPWNNSSLDFGRGVAVLPSGAIVVSGSTEPGLASDVFVQWRMASGNIVDTITIDCQDAADFSFDMAGDDSGNVYVAMRLCGDNSTVHKYDVNGNLVWELDETTFGDVGGFNGIRAITAGPDGSIALASWAGSPLNVWVAKFTQDGDPLWTQTVVAPDGASVGDAVAIDELGYVYVGGRRTSEGTGWVGAFHP